MPFNQLTPAQAERLSLVAEECAEVIQAITKIQRHGYHSKHPKGGPNNRRSLEKELGQLQLAVSLMCRNEDVSTHLIGDAYDSKAAEINRWLHHNCFDLPTRKEDQ
jgi:NTP pyrophosphatase (non-canonical NTP hydrolase)